MINKGNKKNVTSNNKIIWFTIPFVNNISDKFKKIINNIQNCILVLINFAV